MEEPTSRNLPQLPDHLVEANRALPQDRDINFWPLQLRNGVGIDPDHTLREMLRCGTILDWTIAAAKRAQSYRGFRVGAIGIGYDLEQSRLGIRFGANIKLSPDDPGADLNHAEQVVIRKLLETGYPHITGFGIVGPVQADTHSGLVTTTLHPCGICRGIMLETPQIGPNCMIYTLAYGGGQEYVCEQFTLVELVAAHTGHLDRL